MRDKYCFLLFFSSRSIFPPFLFFFLLFFSFPLSRPFSIDTQLGFRFFKLKSSSTSSLAIESRYAHFFSLSFILVHSLSLIHSHSLSLSLFALRIHTHIRRSMMNDAIKNGREKKKCSRRRTRRRRREKRRILLVENMIHISYSNSSYSIIYNSSYNLSIYIYAYTHINMYIYKYMHIYIYIHTHDYAYCYISFDVFFPPRYTSSSTFHIIIPFLSNP